jgi:membrane protease YdiL (CAAX protease family)
VNSSSATFPSALPNPRWHPFFRLLAATGGALVLAVLISIVIGVAISVAAALSGQSTATQTQQFLSENLLLLNLFLYPPVLLWLWICRRFLDRRTFVSLGLRAKSFLGQFFGGAFCGILAVALIFGVLLLSDNLQVRGWSPAAQSGGASLAVLSLLGWALMMLCVGFFEEISFRGYAFHNLRIWLGAGVANILQAAAFALIHLSNLAMQGKTAPDATLAAILALPNIFLIGIFFTLCYFKTGSLWFPIAFHAAWNWAMGCVFSLPVSGLPIFQLFDVSVSGSIFLTGGAFGPEASLLLSPILLALIFVVSRAPDSPQALADLDSLRKIAPEDVADESNETASDVREVESEVARENRFKTRMGKSGGELDDETRRTLRMLNETKRRPEKTARENAAGSTPAAPLKAAPAPPPNETDVPIPASVAAQNETNEAAAPPAGSTPGALPAPQKSTTEKNQLPPTDAESTPGAPNDAPAETPKQKPKSKPAPRW